jgi:SlyX protein
VNTAEQIAELEMRLAFQEQTIDALDRALQHQQQQIIVLEQQLQRLKRELTAARAAPDFLPADQEPPPPHY